MSDVWVFTQSSRRTQRFFFFGTHIDIGHIGFRVFFLQKRVLY
jgi:hypothetical protein